jgi:hypothetical protein
MNPIFNERVVKHEVYHKNYNLDKKDNIDELPEEPAVFGIFGIIHEVPIHPRYIASTNNLRQAVRDAFEKPQGEGMIKFMQGPWIQMLCYELLPGLTEVERKTKEEAWINEYKPGINDDGEYPGYNYEWPYDDDGIMKPEYVNPPKARV